MIEVRVLAPKPEALAVKKVLVQWYDVLSCQTQKARDAGKVRLYLDLEERDVPRDDREQAYKTQITKLEKELEAARAVAAQHKQHLDRLLTTSPSPTLFGPNRSRPGWSDTEWAVLLVGPGDWHSQPDLDTALRYAAEMNAMFYQIYDGHPNSPVMCALVLHWGYAWKRDGIPLGTCTCPGCVQNEAEAEAGDL